MDRGIVSRTFDVTIIQGNAKSTYFPILVVDGVPLGTTQLCEGHTYSFRWSGNDEWCKEELGDIAFCKCPYYSDYGSLDEFQVPGTDVIHLGEVGTITLNNIHFPNALFICCTRYTPGCYLPFNVMRKDYFEPWVRPSHWL